MNKPPIGASPEWYILPHRIKDLSDAISRYTEHERIGSDKEVTSVMRKWATEIICHCDTLDRLNDLKEGRNDRK